MNRAYQNNESVPSRESIDEQAFRGIMASFPTGIGVVTAGRVGELCVGLTVSSISSVSKAPPLISVCLADNAFTLQVIRERKAFVVNLLDNAGASLAFRFAGKRDDKFKNLDVRVGKSGAPILPGCVAFAECALHQIVLAGDHGIVIGRIIDGSSEPVKNPLLYFRGRYYGELANSHEPSLT